MMYDSMGYIYFCDRLGDTYRWRGENVSTIEVENVISKHLKQTEVVVYGVEIPGQEGKAGMAAVVVENNIDLNLLAKSLIKDLPSYARPLFIRLTNEVEHTGKLLLKKNFSK
jgi:acyl-CoA synthetase (AMP-forming)/AMP-acid ligase II